ncbi:MAG: hypothetical protein ACR2FY_22920 [Pirellulaceae bacterium]
MTATTPDLSKPTGASQSVPAWIASGILGLALGAGAMFLGLQLYEETVATTDAAGGGAAPPVAGGGAPMMGMGGMGGGGMGGGGGGKRNLTSLVGKLELLSRAELKLQIELDADQAKKVAGKLAEIDKAEKMTAEEAQSHLDALEALLTAEQKTTLGLISLPFGRQGGGGGGRGGGLGAAGRPGGASAPPVPALEGQQPRADAPPMPGVGGGMGGGSSDENPFTQEANQKRLKDLLGRLAPAAAAAEPPETPADTKGAE